MCYMYMYRSNAYILIDGQMCACVQYMDKPASVEKHVYSDLATVRTSAPGTHPPAARCASSDDRRR